jgi:hypothetical protein
MHVWFKNWWHVLVTVVAGLMAFGSLRADVAQLKEDNIIQATDHDRIVRMDEKIINIESDITEMKDDLNEIAKAVK